MASTWTAFFYGNKGAPISPLTPTNYAEWNDRILSVLKPYKDVLDILQGKTLSGNSSYSPTVDNELFFFIVRNIHPGYTQFVLNARDRFGLKGSKLYQEIARCSEKKEAKPVEDDTSPDFEMTGVKLADPALKKRALDRQGGFAGRRRRSLTPQRVDVRNYPVLSPMSWLEWDKRLQRDAARHRFAAQTLTGSIAEGHPRYLRNIDSTLFAIIQSSAIHNYRGVIAKIVAEHGKKGSKLYTALKRAVQLQVRASFLVSLKKLEEESNRTTKEASVKSLHAGIDTLRRYDISFTAEDVKRFVDTLNRKAALPA